MKYRICGILALCANLGFATETRLGQEAIESADLHNSNLIMNQLRQVLEGNEAKKAVVIDSLKSKLQQAIELNKLICQFSWKELQEISRLEELKPLVDQFCESRLGLIKIESGINRDEDGDEEIDLKFQPGSNVRVHIDFKKQYRGPAIQLPDLNVGAARMPCEIMVSLLNSDGETMRTVFSFYNYTSEPLPNYQFRYTVHTEVDQHLLKKLYQVGVWLQQEFDLDDSDDGAKKLFEKSKRLIMNMGRDLQTDARIKVYDDSDRLKVQADKKIKEYLKPILDGFVIAGGYFKF